MQDPHLSFRILIAFCACGLAFGLGIESARAAIAYPSCDDICIASCSTHDGCDDSYVDGSVCHYICLDSCRGEVMMGE